MAAVTTNTIQRNTRQRAAIRNVFLQHDHPLSAQEVLDLAQKEVRGMGLATVYRNLKALVEERWISTVEMPGEAPRDEISGKGHHHHFLCEGCGQLFEIKTCLHDFAHLTPHGFELRSHEIFLYGVCATCRAKHGG